MQVLLSRAVLAAVAAATIAGAAAPTGAATPVAPATPGVAAAPVATGTPAAPDGANLRFMLDAFLAGASVNDPAAHDGFWADDLIYTGSSGRRIGKDDIMKDVRSAPAPKPGDPKATFTAEDVRIQQYGNAALVAFRLVATTVQAESTEVANYFNSGFFVNRNGTWKVVGWQATKIPATPAK